jgi:hypothetical protein
MQMQPSKPALGGLLPLLAASALAVALAGCSPRGAEGPSQFVDGLEFDYGVVPSETVRQHPSDHPEAGMHGGAPPISYHVTLAISDAKSHARIDDARVTLKLTEPKHGIGVFSMPLEPMTIAGATTYGGYISFPTAARYQLTFEAAHIDGRAHSVKARFVYDRPD